MVAESALPGHMRFRMDPAGPVRARLDTVPASYAIVLVDEDHPIWTGESGADRTDLNARGLFAVVAELRNEEGFQDINVPRDVRPTVHEPVRALDDPLESHNALPRC